MSELADPQRFPHLTPLQEKLLGRYPHLQAARDTAVQSLSEEQKRIENLPRNVRKRAEDSAASLGESGRRPSASQYLSGV